MIAQYAKQAALVVKVIPLIEREDVFDVRKLSASPRTQALFGQAKINVLSRAELYGGKFCVRRAAQTA